MKRAAVMLMTIGLFGCGGLNFSQLSPEAQDFHPTSIAVLPATVGEYESARDVVDDAVSKSLVNRGWLENVVDASTIKTQVVDSSELAKDISAYIQQINTLGVSDSDLAIKLRDTFNVDALFLTYVTSWGYGRMEGSKVGRVGLGVKLVDASKGTVIWKANHELIEDYLLFKPKLSGIVEDVLDLLIDEMPH